MSMQQYRALSLSQPSNLRLALQQTLDPFSGLPCSYLFGSILTFPHTVVARIASNLGFDYVFIDAQHTAMSPGTLVQLVQTINFASEGRTVAIVRVPSADSDLLVHALDAGAAGIVFPHIDTAAGAAHAVESSKYASSGGERSLSPSALIPGLTDLAPEGSSHIKVADQHVAVIVQIESQLALDNLQEIAETPGVDALMLGPGDLRLSLGLPFKRIDVNGIEDPKFLQVVELLANVSKKHRKPLMTVTFKVNITDDWMRRFSLLMTSADFASIIRGQQDDLKKMRERLGVGVGDFSLGRANGANEINSANGVDRPAY